MCRSNLRRNRCWKRGSVTAVLPAFPLANSYIVHGTAQLLRLPGLRLAQSSKTALQYQAAVLFPTRRRSQSVRLNFGQVVISPSNRRQARRHVAHTPKYGSVGKSNNSRTTGSDQIENSLLRSSQFARHACIARAAPGKNGRKFGQADNRLRE